MKASIAILSIFFFLVPFAVAQQSMPMTQDQMKMMQHDRDMDHMAKTMTEAAEMCQMMMQQEMATAGLKTGALLFIGLLFTTEACAADHPGISMDPILEQSCKGETVTILNDYEKESTIVLRILDCEYEEHRRKRT